MIECLGFTQPSWVLESYPFFLLSSGNKASSSIRKMLWSCYWCMLVTTMTLTTTQGVHSLTIAWPLTQYSIGQKNQIFQIKVSTCSTILWNSPLCCVKYFLHYSMIVWVICSCDLPITFCCPTDINLTA